MLCSVPSPGKSGTNWLDRLRSNKGFLTTADNENVHNNLGLDHFLHNQNPSQSTRSNSGSTQSVHERVSNRAGQKGRHQRQEKLYSIMSNVLSELFFMDGDAHIKSSKLSRKKFPRKQAIPKSLTTSTISITHPQRHKQQEVKSPDCASKDDGLRVASLNSDNSLKETKEGNVGEEEEEDDDEGERELVGYSRSEVTVIDTSFGVWKSEKVVYRRTNMWKVREKRGKERSFGRKKRKLGSGVRDDDNGDDENIGGAMKKTKVTSSESVAALNQGQNSQMDTREEVCKDKPDVLTLLPKKRFHFSRSPRKSRKGGSPVILIKGIPTIKKQDEKPQRHSNAER